MRTGRSVERGSLLRNRQYVALLLSQSLSVLGDQVTRIALALLLYDRTGSALASSSTYALSYGAYLLGGPLLSPLADRCSRRTVMAVSDAVRLAVVLLLALQPVSPVVFALVVVLGAASPAFASARSAALPEILGPEHYPGGVSLMSSVLQLAQFTGFAVGGGLVSLAGTQVALLVDAGTFGLSAAAVVLALSALPAADAARTGLPQQVLDGLKAVWQSRGMRHWLSWGLLLAVAAAVPEGLAVAVSAHLKGGASGAGALSASLPLGFVLGTLLVVRQSAEERIRRMGLWCLVSAGSLVITPLLHDVRLVALLWLIGGAGGAAQVVANTEFGRICPPELRGRAFGVAGTALMVGQGLGVLVVGAASAALSASTVVAATGAALAALGLALQCRRPAAVGSRVPSTLPTTVRTGGGT